MIIRSNALQQTGKQCSSFSSVVLVCVSNSELLLEYCHIMIHSDRTMFYTWVGNRNNIVCPLYSYGVRISLRQSLLRRKKLQGGRVRTFSLPCIFITLHLRIFIFKSCGLLKTADLAVENSYFGKYLGKGHA